MPVVLKSTKNPNMNIPDISLGNLVSLNKDDFAYINIIAPNISDNIQEVSDFFYAITTNIPEDLFNIKFVEKDDRLIKEGPLVNRSAGYGTPCTADNELLKILGEIAIKEAHHSGIKEIVSLVELREVIDNIYTNSYTSIKAIGY